MEKFNSNITLSPGISKSASVSSDAIIGQNTFIDDFVIIKPGARIGDNTKIYGQVFIGDNVSIGNNVTLYPGVKVYHNCEIGNNTMIHANVVIGSDGFGFARDEEGKYKKIPQTGNVIIEDNVEIGSNTVIDRASIGSTIIKEGVKLDNLIQIAHNVTVGQNTAIAALTAVAGSSEVGSNCMIGGQVGISGHIQIADGTMIQGQSGVTSSVKGPNAKLYGTPAIEFQSYLKSFAYFKKLPEIVQQIRDIQTSFDIFKEKQKTK
jgi:UDP-3-O-[3-hydroxymyristoyl] glucosamine N-acyltransferase